MLEAVVLYVPILLMLVLLLLGVPIAVALGVAGGLGLYFVFGTESMTAVFSTVAHSQTAGFLLTTIPMFVLMAEFINESDLTQHLFTAGERWLSHIPGGLAIATTIANGGFAVLSGSSLAAAATMSSVAVPEMRKRGYRDTLAMGTVSASGTFAAMLPPSLALIIFGIWTETSVAGLFIGGIVPGVVTLLGYVAIIVGWTSIDGEVAGGLSRYSWSERFRSVRPIWPMAIIVVLVLGGLYSGAITASEAGAVGAAGAFLVAVFLMGMRFNGANRAIRSAAETTAMIFLIIIGAVIFTRYMAFTGIIDEILDLILALPVGVLGTVIIILALYVFLGTFMNQIAILLLTLPITYPLFVNEFGFSAIWLGVVLVKTGEIGLVTPPLGMNVYVAAGAIDVDIGDAFRGASVFLIADVVILALMVAFPEVVMYLPNNMMG